MTDQFDNIHRYIKAVEHDIQAINATFSNASNRHLRHLRHFFRAIEPHLEYRIKCLKGYVQGSNVAIPQIVIPHEVMPDIFSYSGYDETAVLRDQTRKDAIVVKMLDESLERGPAIVVDIGTYDGKRTRSLIDGLYNKTNIVHLIGIDTNPAVNSAFDGLGIRSSAFNYDFLKLQHIFAGIPVRKIYLGLENVLMNISKIDGCEHQDLSGVLAMTLAHDDDAIFEVSNFYNPKRYVNGVEAVFHRYFEDTGLKALLGGELKSDGNYDVSQKRVVITGVKEEVEFEGKVYRFPRPKLRFKTNMGSDMDFAMFSEPVIFLGVSQSLPREEVFINMIMAYIKHLIIEKDADFRFVEGDSVIKLHKNHKYPVPSDDNLARLGAESVFYSDRRGIQPLYSNLTDILIGKGLYPAYYNKLIDEYDELLYSEQMSHTVRCFIRNRIGKTTNRVQGNMTRYEHLLFSGRAKPLKPKKEKEIPVISLIDVKFPPQY